MPAGGSKTSKPERPPAAWQSQSGYFSDSGRSCSPPPTSISRRKQGRAHGMSGHPITGVAFISPRAALLRNTKIVVAVNPKNKKSIEMT